MVNAGRCDAKSIGKRWSCWTSRPRTIGKRYIFQTPFAKPMEAAEWIWRRSTQRFPLALEARSEKCNVFQWLWDVGCCDAETIGKRLIVWTSPPGASKHVTFFRPRLQNPWQPLNAATPNPLEKWKTLRFSDLDSKAIGNRLEL